MDAMGQRMIRALLPALGLLAALAPLLDQALARHAAAAQLAALRSRMPDGDVTRACALDARRTPLAAAGLASWQTISGCGAGASSGSGGGVKWIGRNVRGGLIHVECQANYIDMPYGYNFVGTSLVTYDVTHSWSLGVSVPYLYKYMVNPHQLGYDLANKGPGDVNVLTTLKLGETNAWATTLSVGLPTGTHDVAYKSEPIWQDRQLGLGKPTASLTLDYTVDAINGPSVLGGNVNYRGGENDLGSYRAPTATLYGYTSYLLGPFVPAAGLSVTGYADNDRDRLQEQAVPRASVAANVSLEWSTDWIALLVGASFPYDLAVRSELVRAYNRWGAWTLALGVAFAPL
jgi:hypothetical protein